MNDIPIIVNFGTSLEDLIGRIAPPDMNPKASLYLEQFKKGRMEFVPLIHDGELIAISLMSTKRGAAHVDDENDGRTNIRIA